MSVIHWLEEIENGTRRKTGHVNPIRISAESMVRLMDLRNQVAGTNRSIFEQSQLAEEQ